MQLPLLALWPWHDTCLFLLLLLGNTCGIHVVALVVARGALIVLCLYLAMA